MSAAREVASAPAASDLSQTLVADEVARARRERWSGVLAMRQGQVSKGLYFVDGEIAFAASTVEEDRLGAMLFRGGKISETQFREAMRAAEEVVRPLGHVLVDAGIVTPAELHEAVLAQVERIVLSVLRWTSGSLRREPLAGPLPAGDPMGLDARPLLLVGTRQYPAAVRLEVALGGEQRRLRRAQPPPFEVESLAPTPAERAVLALCTRACPLGRLLTLPHAREDVVRAVYGLLVGGLLEDAAAR